MSDTRTLSVAVKSLPVRSLSVTVLEGPDAGKRVSAQADRLTVGTAEDNDLQLTDETVSRYHLELVCRGGQVELHDHESTNGTFEGAVRIVRGVCPLGATLRLGAATRVRIDDSPARDVELLEGDALGPLKGRSSAMRRVMARVARVADAPSAVLLSGESGTGKELIATAIHQGSPRAQGPLVVVDCGSLAPNLVASELFGHEKGAFTSADSQHVGAFERAAGGTLFLDEIGELPASLQPTLLGVLERKRFRRVGGTKDLVADVRVVAATNRDLKAEVNAGRFRADLFYRLAVLHVEVPSLRERREDVPLLVDHFLSQLQAPPNSIGVELMQRLKEQAWPGNVRELRNFVEATVALGEPAALGGPAAPDPVASFGELRFKQAKATFERQYLEQVLKRANGNVTEAAKFADLDRSYFHEMMRRHKLKA